MRVSLNQAITLKNIGYDGVVDRAYISSAEIPERIPEEYKKEELAAGHYKNDASTWVAAPTVHQVIQWLIIVKRLYPIVAPMVDIVDEDEVQVLWYGAVYDIDIDSKTTILNEISEYFHSHDEGLTASISYAIELVTTLGRE